MHSHGWMHRDIKPENIYVRADGGVVIGDFNLIRFGNWSDETGKAAEGSTYVCTLWTRAPELVMRQKKGFHTIPYGTETDVYSLGATMLAVAHGNYVLGRALTGQDGDGEYKYLQGVLSLMGRDPDVDAFYGDVTVGMPDADEAEDRMRKWLPAWEDAAEIANVLARMMHPLPHKRMRLKKVLAWLKEKQAFQSWSLQADVAMKNLVQYKSKETVSKGFTSTMEPQCIKPVLWTSAWLAISSSNMPFPLACELVLSLSRSRCGNEFVAPLIHIFKYLHHFHVVGKQRYTDEEMLEAIFHPRIKFHGSVYRTAQQLDQPFACCCFAATLGVYGSEKEFKDVESTKIYMVPEAESFFTRFGEQYKSQLSMLESWKRLER